ncbi:MAG TPA: leucine--tRNA ligase [Acidimicrobiaceae bacterium]|nr:leucine--tRNA ligase [Actinomycetota bacterium]HAZ33602.1 leucine--tRNA ligase [Acidimicrobiaceae bacterium]
MEDSNEQQAERLTPFRYTAALATDIETRWQDTWDERGTFNSPNPAGPLADPDALSDRGEKLFVLDMFPYPSGAGLHVGHPLGYIGTDVYSRFKRMTQHNVLYTMGFDAFGLPAEQYAVQTGQHPAITTDDNVANMRRQLRRLGLSHDRRRSISTTDPEYYRWTQWIFTQIFNSWYDTDLERARPISELVDEFESETRSPSNGRVWAEMTEPERRSCLDEYRLAYVSEAPVNWCPGLGTVVANEEVTADGRSDRGNFPVFKRNMRQWMMRITTYADRLIDDLELLDWSDAIKTMQRNWIGRSHGAHVNFNSAAGPITVFTTRPDTLFGATFMVLAPEHPYVDQLTTANQAESVAAYRSQATAKNDIDRQDDTREKTGVFTGATATNPLTGEEIPVWIADYVLMGYGTGAIMAVPCGDQRDFEFARTFGLSIPAIQQPPSDWFAERNIEPTLDTSMWPEAFVGNAPYVNSANDTLDLNGISSVGEAVATTNSWLEKHGRGEATINYKLRDWLFSRQRYWGEPFPVVYDEHGNAHTLPDDMLPVVLPETDSFSPRTFDADDEHSDPESPLDRLNDWVELQLDLGDGLKTYRRDTNVMPQWAGSCWYELRYLDPTNDDRFVDPAVESYWMGPRTDLRPDHPGGVDLYVGGVEHAVLHLLYARFWHKVLYDLGHVSSKEPYARLFNQGYILANAFKDERGIYVDAFSVEERDGAFYFEGDEVTREWGKMGKSLKNAVSPDEMYEAYGADTLRLYEMAMGPLDASRPWETRDVVGMFRFLQRLWRTMVVEETGELRTLADSSDDETRRLLHRTIDVVRTEMEALRFNTAIAKLIELNNHVTKVINATNEIPREVAESMVLMVAPLVPHIAEELWSKLGNTESLTYAEFPSADPALLVDDEVEMPVQVRGKVRTRVMVPANADEKAITDIVLSDERVIAALDGADPATLKKIIVVPGRMVNLVP